MQEVEVTYRRDGEVGRLRVPRDWAKDVKTVKDLFWPSEVLQVEEIRGRVFWNLEDSQKMKGNKHIREVKGFIDPYWCDYCRTFTDQPEKHRHGERPLD